MFGPGKDFVFSVKRDEVRNARALHLARCALTSGPPLQVRAIVACPLLVLMGRDVFHPSQIAREVASLAPHAELIESWRDDGEAIAAAALRIEEFLTAHS